MKAAKRFARRDDILDVAVDCFLAQGYAATSMAEIAARRGGSKATLYNYFKSKEVLFAAVMERQCASLAETLFDVAHDHDNPRERLEHFALSFLERLRTPTSRGLRRLVVGEGDRFPEIGRLFYAYGPKVVLEKIAAYLADLMAHGVLRAAPPMIAAQQFIDLSISTALHPHFRQEVSDQPEAEDLATQVRCAVDTFLRAYRPD